MKLVILFIAISLHVSASLYSQEVTLNYKNAQLIDVLHSIGKQTGYNFFINSPDIEKAKPVTLTLKSVPLNKTLLFLFKDQPFTYQLLENTIIVKLKPNNSFAVKPIQQQDLTGFVTDSTGKPLSGADISLVSEISKRTFTDDKGHFILKNVPEQGILLIRLIGYQSRQVTYSRNAVTIVLQQAISELDEVHVIAYGTTSKRLTTGNIDGIKSSDIERQPVSNPLLALTGRIPGLFISQSTGIAGSGVVVRIQGQNSIDNGNDPFYVVDGMPYSSQLFPTINNTLGSSGSIEGAINGNPLSYLNPNDIESIEVLKDADATAIYGSRAANGAILITTKKGKVGKTSLDVTIQSGIGEVGRKMKLLNTQQYLEMRKEAYTNDGRVIPTPTTGTKSSANYDLTVFDPNRYTDWQKELIGGNAHYTDMQASVSGGSNQTTFRLNGGYHKETTVFPGEFSDVKGSFGININHSSYDRKFKVQFSGNYLNDNNQLPQHDLTLDALSLPPNAPALYKADGSLNWQRIPLGPDSVSTWINPLSYFKGSYVLKTDNLIANTNFSYAIINGLVIKANLGYNIINTRETSTSPRSAITPEIADLIPRSAIYGNGRFSSWILEPQLTYNFSIGKGRVEFLVGSTFQENNNDYSQLNGQGYTSDNVLNDFRSASILTAGANRKLSTYKYNALFSRINYNWDNKYIVNITARRDGSSRFGAANRFHNFGAIGAAWLFSNEDFIRNNLSFFSFGKLRASYGSTGNDQIGDYAYLNEYKIILSDNPYQSYTGLEPISHPNPYLQWELTKKVQIGIDLGFFRDHILFNVNYFNNRSSNQLLTYSLPDQTGFPGVLRNFPADVGNSGWEFTLNTINIQTTAFNWTSSFNLTFNRNKLLSFPNLNLSTYANRLYVGLPITIQKVYNFAGVDPQTGLYQYYTGDGKITGSPTVPEDNTVLYNNNPKCYGGFQNSISYKGFELDFLLQFVKQQAQNYRLGTTFRVGVNVNEPIEVLQRWQKPGDNTNIQKFSTRAIISDALSSSYAYADASYIRLKNVALSYTLPSAWIKVAKIQKSRLFIQGQNLLTLTNYIGLDPENSSKANLPPLRIVTFGVQVTL